MAAAGTRKQTRRERIASGKAAVATGIADILAGTATADDVLADVAEVVPEVFSDGTQAATLPDAPDAPAIPDVPSGATFITLTERDRIRESGNSTPTALGKALMARVAAGVLVRPNGKPAAKFAQDDVLPKYYRNFLLAVALTPAMRQSVTTTDVDPAWGWANTGPTKPRTVTVKEAAVAAPRLPSPEVVAKQARVRKAKATIDAIDVLPGAEYTEAIGTTEAQDALETLAKASVGADREDAADE